MVVLQVKVNFRKHDLYGLLYDALYNRIFAVSLLLTTLIPACTSIYHIRIN